MNDDHDKEMLDENTSNSQGQKSLTYEFSTLDETVKEEEGAKSSLCNLKLRNMNRLIRGQINIDSIRNRSELFSLWFQIILICYEFLKQNLVIHFL